MTWRLTELWTCAVVLQVQDPFAVYDACLLDPMDQALMREETQWVSLGLIAGNLIWVDYEDFSLGATVVASVA